MPVSSECIFFLFCCWFFFKIRNLTFFSSVVRLTFRIKRTHLDCMNFVVLVGFSVRTKALCVLFRLLARVYIVRKCVLRCATGKFASRDLRLIQCSFFFYESRRELFREFLIYCTRRNSKARIATSVAKATELFVFIVDKSRRPWRLWAGRILFFSVWISIRVGCP